jgi:hypothetical protein
VFWIFQSIYWVNSAILVKYLVKICIFGQKIYPHSRQILHYNTFKVLILFLFIDRDCDEDLCYSCLLAHQRVKLTRKKNCWIFPPSRKLLLKYQIFKSFPPVFRIHVQKKSQSSTYESRFFLLFLLNGRRIRIREAQKHVDPVDPDPDWDPDPEHCFSLT